MCARIYFYLKQLYFYLPVPVNLYIFTWKIIHTHLQRIDFYYGGKLQIQCKFTGCIYQPVGIVQIFTSMNECTKIKYNDYIYTKKFSSYSICFSWSSTSFCIMACCWLLLPDCPSVAIVPNVFESCSMPGLITNMICCYLPSCSCQIQNNIQWNRVNNQTCSSRLVRSMISIAGAPSTPKRSSLSRTELILSHAAVMVSSISSTRSCNLFSSK